MALIGQRVKLSVTCALFFLLKPFFLGAIKSLSLERGGGNKSLKIAGACTPTAACVYRTAEQYPPGI